MRLIDPPSKLGKE
jgi:flagellar biosynthesis/type III secretory pathway M-ring protein FliF/YscJ